MTPLLEVEDVRVHFPIRGRPFAPRAVVRAVDGVSLGVGRGETVGVIGESGSGKTTLGRAILRLIEPTSGAVRLDGEALNGLPPGRMKAVRRRMQVVFQDPTASLNPALSVGAILGEAMHIHAICPPRERPARVGALLERVGLPGSVAGRRPAELSGGQRQRVAIARALSIGPELIVADEAVSALDVSVQAQIINLLQDLQAETGMAMLFIGHDLAVVEHLCDRVVVLYLGRVMETGPVAEVFAAPRHPYTRALLDAKPVIEPGLRRARMILSGEPPSPVSPPSGCVFRTRCPHAAGRCAEVEPRLEGEGHAAACIRQGELSL